jgi:DNA-binding response OmpR family regulator
VLTVTPGRILVVEDEPRVADSIRRGLEDAGFEVRVACSCQEGFFRFHEQPTDLVVLDLMLPDHGGLEMLRMLREAKVAAKVLIVSALGALEDRVTGLETGADDYLPKPFALAELVARVRALLRRDAPAPCDRWPRANHAPVIRPRPCAPRGRREIAAPRVSARVGGGRRGSAAETMPPSSVAAPSTVSPVA